MNSRRLLALALPALLALPTQNVFALSPGITGAVLGSLVMGAVQDETKKEEEAPKVIKELAIPESAKEAVSETTEQYARLQAQIQMTMKAITAPVEGRLKELEEWVEEGDFRKKEAEKSATFLKEYSSQLAEKIGLGRNLAPAAQQVVGALLPVLEAEGMDKENDSISMTINDNILYVGIIQVDWDQEARKKATEISEAMEKLKPNLQELVAKAIAEKKGEGGVINLDAKLSPENQKKMEELEKEMAALEPRLVPKNPRLRLTVKVDLTIELPKAPPTTEEEAKALRLCKAVKLSLVDGTKTIRIPKVK